MNNEQGSIEKMDEAESQQKINKLKQKIETTQYNIEVSSDIIADTPSAIN